PPRPPRSTLLPYTTLFRSDALYAATRDTNARVRSRAVAALAATKDPNLAHVYKRLLEDQSYAVIRAAAIALGQTKSPEAFESLRSEEHTSELQSLTNLVCR